MKVHLLLTLLFVVTIPSNNIEPSYTETEYCTETFQTFREKEKIKKQKQDTRKAMYAKIKKMKQQKLLLAKRRKSKSKQCQILTKLQPKKRSFTNERRKRFLCWK